MLWNCHLKNWPSIRLVLCSHLSFTSCMRVYWNIALCCFKCFVEDVRMIIIYIYVSIWDSIMLLLVSVLPVLAFFTTRYSISVCFSPTQTSLSKHRKKEVDSCYFHFFRLRWSQPLWSSKTLGELLDGSFNGWFDVEINWPSWETDFCTRPCIRQVRALHINMVGGKRKRIKYGDAINILSNDIIYLYS